MPLQSSTGQWKAVNLVESGICSDGDVNGDGVCDD